MTNRDIYKAVTRLEKQEMPSLEAYLRSLWSVVAQDRDEALTAEKFVEWVMTAWVMAPPPFNPEWLERHPKFSDEADFEAWEYCILYQIADLRKMHEAGLLNDEYRYFGIDSPSGSRWYNFDPLTYLECGVRGELGGYLEDEVIVLIEPVEGESADSPVFEVADFTWEMFIGILGCGQMYE